MFLVASTLTNAYAIYSKNVLVHKVTTSFNTIQIEDASAVSYYPGVLMNFTHRPISNSSLIFSKDEECVRIYFAKITHDCTWEYVLLAIYNDEASLTGMSTILIPNSVEDSYLSVETDIGIIDKVNSGKETFSTQELIYQQSAQDVYMHYNTVKKALTKLMQLYIDEGLPDIVNDYEKIMKLLDIVISFVGDYMSGYNKLVKQGYAVIFDKQYYGPNYGPIDSEWLYAVAEDDFVAKIIGEVELYHLVNNYYWLHFEGGILVIGTGITTYFNSKDVIDFLYYELAFGVGQVFVAPSSGEGYQWVEFEMIGYATWDVYISSYFTSTPSFSVYVSATASAGMESGFDYVVLQAGG